MDKVSVYVVIVDDTEEAFVALSNLLDQVGPGEGPTELARGVEFDYALGLAKDAEVALR